MYTTASAEQSGLEQEPARRVVGRRRSVAAGNARRLLLLQTTLRLIADEGIDAVSHRAVAEAAGVRSARPRTGSPRARRCCARRSSTSRGSRSRPSTSTSPGVLGKRLSRRRLVDEFTAMLLPAARRAALADGRPVRADPGGRASARARAGLPRVDGGMGARRSPRSSSRSALPIPSSRRVCSWRCSTACC